MDLNHVSAFVRVVQEGSFTAAARVLGLPKSSVSRSIAQLEQDLGVRLLHRTTRKLHLTEAGTSFHDRVSRALSDIDEATSAASDLQRELRGSIRVSAPLDLGVWAVAPIVARFVRRHPTVNIEVRLASRIVDLVAEGFDLAVRAGRLRDESLIARRVGSIDLGLYASSRYLARRGVPEAIDQLEGHDGILFRAESGLMKWKLTSSAGVEESFEPRGGIAADDISFLKKAALAGGGIALLPSFLVAREEEAGKLVRVLPDWRSAGDGLHVVYPSARYVPQRVVAFRDYLVQELGKLTSRCEAIRGGVTKRTA
ncbi:MAG: LysR family transcriptional regulator [Labilithrix sp.]|nr:LysR family transcriptional regulator [Labilithrix sp.]MBX3225364.1 LysR family transcriptional regulator [Labilithrix sp.]